MKIRKPDAPSGLKPLVGSKELRIARALGNRHEPTSAELKLARHMAQEGVRMTEIHAALGWKCTVFCTTKRLKKFNIRGRAHENRRNHNYISNLPGGQINTKTWHPKNVISSRV